MLMSCIPFIMHTPHAGAASAHSLCASEQSERHRLVCHQPPNTRRHTLDRQMLVCVLVCVCCYMCTYRYPHLLHTDILANSVLHLPHTAYTNNIHKQHTQKTYTNNIHTGMCMISSSMNLTFNLMYQQRIQPLHLKLSCLSLRVRQQKCTGEGKYASPFISSHCG